MSSHAPQKMNHVPRGAPITDIIHVAVRQPSAGPTTSVGNTNKAPRLVINTPVVTRKAFFNRLTLDDDLHSPRFNASFLFSECAIFGRCLADSCVANMGTLTG